MRILGGQAKGRRFIAPQGRETRPPLARLRQSIFSLLEGRIEDRRVLDLFAGAGAFGLEALSRGARQVTFVEQRKGTAEVLRQNTQRLGFGPRARVVVGDGLAEPSLLLLAGPREPSGSGAAAESFEIIFLDPPFRLFADPGGRRRLLKALNSLSGGSLLAPGGLLILRHPCGSEGALDFPWQSTRDYGRSAVSFFEKGS